VYRGGGGGFRGGMIGGMVLDYGKTVAMCIGAAFLLAGTAAAGAVAFWLFHITGLIGGYMVTGAPVVMDGYHEGSVQMQKVIAAHGGHTAAPGGALQPPAT
jgi:hypothetical protein